MPTFAEASRRVLEQKQDGWREGRHAQSWWMSLERYAFPRIGARPVSDVTGAEVLDVLTPIWHRKPPTARRVRERIRAVLEWAVAMELRADNPCDRIGSVLGPQHAAVEHMQALPHREVAGAVAAVRASGGAEVVKLAFELLVLTAARWGEVRGARWSEIDVAESVWTIPATRMKANRSHRIPLCGRAMEILDAAHFARRRRRSARVSRPPRGAACRKRASAATAAAGDRRRASWLPVHVPGLGGGGDRAPARSDRGGAGACRPEPGRGGLRPLGPVRAPAAADGRLVRLCERRGPSRCVECFRSRHQRRLHGHDGTINAAARPQTLRPAVRERAHARLRAQCGQGWPLRRRLPPITCN